MDDEAVNPATEADNARASRPVNQVVDRPGGIAGLADYNDVNRITDTFTSPGLAVCPSSFSCFA